MTEGQKTLIMNLRKEGYGYVRIAQRLEISENTVKSFCRRNKVAGKVDVTRTILPPVKGGKHFCLYCGEEVEQNPGRKEKKFCSDKCRNRWWNSHLDRVDRRANYEFVCLHCKSILRHTAMQIGSIAAMNAILRTDLEVERMTEKQFRNEKLYLVTMKMAKALLKKELCQRMNISRLI